MTQRLRIEVRLPEGHWAGDFTRSHPQAVLSIEEHMALGRGRGTASATIRSTKPKTLLKDLEDLTSIDSLVLWEETGELLRFRVEISKGGGGFLKPLRKVGVVPRTPFEVRDGWVDWSIECDHDNARSLIEELVAAGIPHRVLSLGSSEGDRLLTQRQRQVFELALAEGYFDRPRRINQSRMAEILGISKSTLCEIMQGLERRVMKGFAEDIRRRSS